MSDSSHTCLDTLFELMAIPAPTGQEEPVLAWCRDRWASMGAEVHVSLIGNGPRLLLQGHVILSTSLSHYFNRRLSRMPNPLGSRRCVQGCMLVRPARSLFLLEVGARV
jgi:hypothetical protein